MTISETLVVLHADLIRKNYTSAVQELCNLLELCRAGIKYSDNPSEVMYKNLENLMKDHGKNPKAPTE